MRSEGTKRMNQEPPKDSEEEGKARGPTLMELLNPELLAKSMLGRQEQERRSQESVFGPKDVPEQLKNESMVSVVERQAAVANAVGKALNRPTLPAKPTVSEELRGLLVQYCATMIQAIELEQVDWEPLAKRLGTYPEHLSQAAEVANQDQKLWKDVLTERIRRLGAARTFRDVKWEQLESKTLNLLMQMVELNLIKDPGELLAIAAQARKVNVQDHHTNQTALANSFTINIGNESMGQDGLPAAGTKMTIDLSPRIAASLAKRNEVIDGEGRVIDSEMLNAKELRSVLEERNQRKANPEGGSDE